MILPITFEGEIPRAPVVQQALIGQRPQNFAFKYIRFEGSPHMKVDGSSTPVIFKYTVPEGKSFFWARSVIHLKSFTTNPNDFGAILDGLNNGLLMSVKDADEEVLIDFLDGETVKTNTDFGDMASVDVVFRTVVPARLDSLLVRWTVQNAGAAMILSAGESFTVTVQDDLSGLSAMRMMLQGLLYNV